MERQDEQRPGQVPGGAANTPPFGRQPPAVRTAGDHQIPSDTSAAAGTRDPLGGTKEELDRTREMLGDHAQGQGEGVRAAAAGAVDAAKDPALQDQARRTAETAKREGQRLGRELGDRAESRINEGMQQAAERLETAAERIDRLAGERLDDTSGLRARAGDLAHTTADTMESVARYLRENDAEALRSDLSRQVRENPLQTLMIGVAAGWVAGKILR